MQLKLISIHVKLLPECSRRLRVSRNLASTVSILKHLLSFLRCTTYLINLEGNLKLSSQQMIEQEAFSSLEKLKKNFRHFGYVSLPL